MPTATSKTYFRDTSSQPWSHYAPSDLTYEVDTLANLKRRQPERNRDKWIITYTANTKIEERFLNGFWVKHELTFH